MQVHDLKESDLELKLILEMYSRESTDSRSEYLLKMFFLIYNSLFSSF